MLTNPLVLYDFAKGSFEALLQTTAHPVYTPVWPALLVVEAQDVHQLMYDGVLEYQRSPQVFILCTSNIE